MESSWTKVRQLVANRVLTRHLQDLQDQHVAMEMMQQQNAKQVERELLASRNRVGSVQIAPTEAPIPTSRRHSMPVPPRPTASQTPRHRGATDKKVAKKNLTVGPKPSTTTAAETGEPSLLDMMASTLQSARTMEQRRPSLYLQTSRTSKMSGILGSKDIPLAPSTKRERTNAAVDQSPMLEKGETFLSTDQSQVLSFVRDSSSDTTTETKAGMQKKGAKAKTKRQQKNGKTSSSNKKGHKYILDTDFGPPDRENASADFCDEDTGLEKDDGGFTPKDLALPLAMLAEENEEADEDIEFIEEEEEQDGKDVEENGTEIEEHDPWSEVRKCQYIRGYDPPHMRMPKDSVKFVFGGDDSESSD